mmetsp:Transcript_283/g.376  ORF Transcript_283/g.376 Transcript_283/m.376 type:complete len:98 (-) Transcript_283:45-338(-)
MTQLARSTLVIGTREVKAVLFGAIAFLCMERLPIKHAVHAAEVARMHQLILEILVGKTVIGMLPQLPDAKAMAIALGITAMLLTRHVVSARVGKNEY